MSPRLKPLLLPQLVDQRRKWEVQQSSPDCDLSYVYYTTNSSSSDITSPITPTFSPKGHFRVSSSASSLELPPQLQESPVSPTQTVHSKSKSLLPDVQEEPFEPEDDDDDASDMDDHFGLYSCLCMFFSFPFAQPHAATSRDGSLTRTISST